MKAELHPLYAIAIRRDFGFDPKDDVWLIFARNRGDEGFCSSKLWDAGFEDYTFRLPWLEGYDRRRCRLEQDQLRGHGWDIRANS
jgi:hypothetical protein